ncbi:hypothetical protein [Streptomyces sp. NPDC091273]|uniref:hypothetical protein n=1 Tax=unclassified Streptomyces TaxID=2593676 RepID=UPI00288391EC|nr:hypothetical protein [Streptomyces sp. DSM 41633]
MIDKNSEVGGPVGGGSLSPLGCGDGVEAEHRSEDRWGEVLGEGDQGGGAGRPGTPANSTWW